MKKLNKKSASLAALQIGTALSPLTVLAQASADTVDDVVAKAESAGLKVRVEDKGDIKVNSKSEADTKNAEADAQLKRMLLKWHKLSTTMWQKNKLSKKPIKKLKLVMKQK